MRTTPLWNATPRSLWPESNPTPISHGQRGGAGEAGFVRDHVERAGLVEGAWNLRDARVAAGGRVQVNKGGGRIERPTADTTVHRVTAVALRAASPDSRVGSGLVGTMRKIPPIDKQSGTTSGLTDRIKARARMAGATPGPSSTVAVLGNSDFASDVRGYLNDEGRATAL